VAQSFLTADDRPAARVGPLERLPGTARVVEFPRGVVVEDEQAERRLPACCVKSIGIGFSHHSVPSLSNTATRSSTGTAADTVRSTNSTSAFLAGPSFQLANARGSASI
jgi:hypothetical protein